MKIAFLIVCLLSLTGAAPASENPCSGGDLDHIDPRFNFILLQSKLLPSSTFRGEFELHNISISEGIKVQGTNNSEGFTAPLAVTIQFKDLNGSWVPLALAQGSGNVRHVLNVPSGEKKKIIVDLFSQSTALRSSSEFRVLLRASRPNLCIVSHPFHSTPKRPLPTGLANTGYRP